MRPMNSHLYVMSGVVPKISGEDIVPTFDDIVGRFKFILGIKARVVIVRVPGGVVERHRHRNCKEYQRIEPIDQKEASEEQQRDATAH